jgi:hypothetical protein
MSISQIEVRLLSFTYLIKPAKEPIEPEGDTRDN